MSQTPYAFNDTTETIAPEERHVYRTQCLQLMHSSGAQCI